MISTPADRNRRGASIITCMLGGGLIGGVIGLLCWPDSALNRNHDPQAQVFASILRPAETFFGVVFTLTGIGIGVGLGALAGTIIPLPPTATAENESSPDPRDTNPSD